MNNTEPLSIMDNILICFIGFIMIFFALFALFIIGMLINGLVQLNIRWSEKICQKYTKNVKKRKN